MFADRRLGNGISIKLFFLLFFFITYKDPKEVKFYLYSNIKCVMQLFKLNTCLYLFMYLYVQIGLERW